MEKTEYFPPEVKPVHVGMYETSFFDAGWIYEIRVWWNGRQWLDCEQGWALIDQNVTWRGLNADHG